MSAFSPAYSVLPGTRSRSPQSSPSFCRIATARSRIHLVAVRTFAPYQGHCLVGTGEFTTGSGSSVGAGRSGDGANGGAGRVREDVDGVVARDWKGLAQERFGRRLAARIRLLGNS